MQKDISINQESVAKSFPETGNAVSSSEISDAKISMS